MPRQGTLLSSPSLKPARMVYFGNVTQPWPALQISLGHPGYLSETSHSVVVIQKRRCRLVFDLPHASKTRRSPKDPYKVTGSS